MDRRTELLNSAENAARKRGYDGFSYADLAKEVGIRKASIHYYFPSKSDLTVALIERYSENILKSLDRISNKGASAAEQLDAYIENYRKALSGGKKLCLCVALSISRDSLPDEALKHLDAFHSASLAWLTKVFKLAKKDGSIAHLGEAKSEAAALLATVEGAQLIARSSQNVCDYNQATSLLKHRLS